MPATKSITLVVGAFGLLKVIPPPLITVQTPVCVPIKAVAFKVVVVASHKSWSKPASTSIGLASTVIVTTSETIHSPFSIVHVNS